MFTYNITDATQFETVYLGDKPIATLQRKRRDSRGPEWSCYNLSGQLIFTAIGPRTIKMKLHRHFGKGA